MTKVLPADVEKEIRALALPWLATAAVIVLGSSGVPLLKGFEAAAYFLGVAALGGLSMGQEYSHRTLGSFLSLPVRRERMFIVKWGVLAVLLLALDALIWATHAETRALAYDAPLLLALPTLCALFVAPCLTMWSRSALAGTVLAGGLPGTVFVTTQLVVYWVTGDVLNEAFILVRTTPIVCALAAVLSWRMFMRLEAIDGGGRDLRLPAWSSAGIDTITRHNPTWLLIKKEIGLQQISLALGGVLVFSWIVAMTLRQRVDHMAAIFNVMTFCYSASLALIIGMVASAEERQLGTHEWQALLPMSSARQWSIKVAVALTLSFLLALVLPTALLYFMNDSINNTPLVEPVLILIADVAVATTLGLYFSSLSTSGLRALVLGVPAMAVAMLIGGRLNSWEGVPWFIYGMWRMFLHEIGYFSWSYEARARASFGLELLLVAWCISILLRFALTNHRSAAPLGPHLWRQWLVIGLGLSLAAFILTLRVSIG